VRKACATNKEGENSELETFTVDQFTAYLERHQRTAPSLLAVWNLTKDQAVLREAFEKFPGDPSVVLPAFQHLDLPAEKKLSLAARLEQEHPRNSLGPVLAGVQMAKDGQNAEAIESNDAVPWHLSRLDEPRLDLYLQILEHRGQREALKWAETYHGPAPKNTASP